MANSARHAGKYHLFLRPILRCLCLLFVLVTASRGADYPPWEGTPNSNYVLSSTVDLKGNLWVGTESDGVWSAAPGGHWTHWTTRYGLGEMDGRALACDKQGRVWASHTSQGVSVFNGRRWRSYDVRTGPLGGHVFALAVSPQDGSVWIATNAGLTRYLPTSDTWTYVTRAEGLPSDQTCALVFGKSGTLYAASQCDGIAIAQSTDNYKTWHVVTGPDRTAPVPWGTGLPSPLVNCLMAARDGTIYAGTDRGLAWSKDDGTTWRYARGADWLAKARNGDNSPLDPEAPVPPPGALSEDYVTALAEDSSGALLVGHRRTGLETVTLAALLPLKPQPDGTYPPAEPPGLPEVVGWIQTLLPLPGRTTAVGTYGGGLVLAQPLDAPISDYSPVLAGPGRAPPLPPALPLPSAAAVLGKTQFTSLTQKVHNIPASTDEFTGAYLGDDWATEGDWVGRYGQKYAVLCGFQEQGGDNFGGSAGYGVSRSSGPHVLSAGTMYSYVGELTTTERRELYSPRLGHRRVAEWNDGSFQGLYTAGFDGPDMWVSVRVPAGPQRISLYFCNADGHKGHNGYRDYLVELKPPSASPAEAETKPALARTRVVNFWGGVYKQFLVRGPAQYWIKIGRNGSFVTKLQGVMVDDLSQPGQYAVNAGWLGGTAYTPPSPHQVTDQQSADNAPAQALWSALDDAYINPSSAAFQQAGRVLAFRAAQRANASDALLANWRWRLPFWTSSDRAVFDAVMQQAWHTQSGTK